MSRILMTVAFLCFLTFLPCARSQTPVENWPGLARTGFDKDVEAVLDRGNGWVYFFRGGHYVRFDVAGNKVIDGPMPTSGNWPGMDDQIIDAALNRGNGQVYFFRGKSYIRFDLETFKVDDGPRPITGNWPGMEKGGFDRGIDAALNMGNRKVYFFRGRNCTRFDLDAFKVDDGYPKLITDDWPGLEKGGFDRDVRAAIKWKDGKVYFFRGREYVRYDTAARRVDAGPTLICPEGLSLKPKPKPWAVILCKFSDFPKYEPKPIDFYKQVFTEAGAGKGTEFDYFRDVSYGNFDMTGSKVFGWYTIDNKSTNKDEASRELILRSACKAAEAKGVDLTKFYSVVAIPNRGSDVGAFSPDGGPMQVALGYGERKPNVVCHELGHGFGLKHTWFARPDTEYGDRWDIMSAQDIFAFDKKFGQYGPGMNAFTLQRLGCILSDRIWSSNKPGSHTISLASLNQDNASGFLMASIPPAPESKSKTSYFIDFRRKKGWDAGIPQDTVLVHEVRSDGTCFLLSRGGTMVDVDLIQVLPGQEFKIAERKLTVKVESFDADASNAKVAITIAK